MSDHLRERIARKLETLTDERLYQVLDYVEFLESKYAVRTNPATTPLQKFTEGIEDRLRAGKVSATTIAETMGFLNKAVGVLNGVTTTVTAAGKSVAADLASAAQRVGTAVSDATSQATSQATGATGTTTSGGAAAPPAGPTVGPTPGPSTGERPS